MNDDNDKNYLSVPSSSKDSSKSSEINENLKNFNKIRRLTDLNDEKLDNWKPSSLINNKNNESDDDDSIKELMERVNLGRKKVQFSERSRKLLDESQQLLDSIDENHQTSEHLIGLNSSSSIANRGLSEEYAST